MPVYPMKLTTDMELRTHRYPTPALSCKRAACDLHGGNDGWGVACVGLDRDRVRSMRMGFVMPRSYSGKRPRYIPSFS